MSVELSNADTNKLAKIWKEIQKVNNKLSHFLGDQYSEEPTFIRSTRKLDEIEDEISDVIACQHNPEEDE